MLLSVLDIALAQLFGYETDTIEDTIIGANSNTKTFFGQSELDTSSILLFTLAERVSSTSDCYIDWQSKQRYVKAMFL